MSQHNDATLSRSGFLELFTPKLISVFKEGYSRKAFKADCISGITVAVVALPLSMAIAIASGLPPEKGLIAAIIGGLLVSLLGGSRFQIGGPAGAFIVLVAATSQKHGPEGLAVATVIAGIILLAIGLLRIGTYIKFIPFPVTVGFTSGIAVIIFISQIKELLGLTFTGKEPAELLPKLLFIYEALPSLNLSAIFIALLTIVAILFLRHRWPLAPGFLLALILSSIVVGIFSLPVETIGSRFGGIPGVLPWPVVPEIDFALVVSVFPDALAFALLGAIESLLSAVVADGMTGRRHRSNCELVAQGVANIITPVFGGMCVTGTIARTATNVRAGAYSPVSGILHSLFVLSFMIFAASWASYLPLAALAGVLAIVAWNMVERHAIYSLIYSSKGDALVLLSTFLLTIFVGLTEAIVVGVALGSIIFIDHMAKSVYIGSGFNPVAEDVADSLSESGVPYDTANSIDPDVVVYRISGVFFFGSASTVSSVLDRIADQRNNFVVDFSAVPFIDSTAASVLAGAVRKAQKAERRFCITGANQQIIRLLHQHDVGPGGGAEFFSDISSALQELRKSV